MNDLERKGREAWAHLVLVLAGFALILLFSAAVGFGLVWLFGDKGATIVIVGGLVVFFLIVNGKEITRGIYAMLYALAAPVLRLFRKKPMRTIQPPRQEGNIPLVEIERAVEEVVARRKNAKPTEAPDQCVYTHIPKEDENA